MEPGGEDCFFATLVHAANGEVVFLAGEEADAVVVHCSDLSESDLEAVAGVTGAIEDESAGVERELARAAAAKSFVVPGMVGHCGKLRSGRDGEGSRRLGSSLDGR